LGSAFGVKCGYIGLEFEVCLKTQALVCEERLLVLKQLIRF